MPLPKALQAQADAADATLAQMYPDTHGAQGQPVAFADPVPPIPLPVPTASESPQPTPQPQPLVQPPHPMQPQPPQGEETWEQRYRTLQGIHNRHVADLKTRIDQLEASNQQMLERLSASTPPQPQPTAQVNPQDAETFGEDLVQMVRRTTEQVLGPLSQSVEQRIARLESSLQGTNKVVAQTADETFFAGLREHVPDFDQINTSEPFLTWLAEPDDLYGQPRQAALTAAGNARDLARVVKVFNAFKDASGIARQPGAPSPSNSRLQAQVSPRSTGNGAAPQATMQQDKPMITVEQVERFYSDVRRGAYRGNEKLQQATEAVINAALAENRIIQRGMHRPAP